MARAITTNDKLNGHLYQIKNLQRINGYKTKAGYVVEFGYEIHMLHDPAEYFGQLMESGNKPFGALEALGLAANGMVRFGFLNVTLLFAHKKDDIVQFSGSIIMIKSERGWIPSPSEYGDAFSGS